MYLISLTDSLLWWSLLPLSKARITRRPPCHPTIYMGAGDQNSYPYLYAASALTTPPHKNKYLIKLNISISRFRVSQSKRKQDGTESFWIFNMYQIADFLFYNSDYINFKIFLINVQYFFRFFSKEKLKGQSILHRIGKQKGIEQAYTFRFIDVDALHFHLA